MKALSLLLVPAALAILSIPFVPAQAQAQAQAQTQETATVTGKAAIARMVGNTIVTRLIEAPEQAQEGKLYLRADGTATLVNIRKGAGPVAGRWRLDDRERLCIAGLPQDMATDQCARIEITGDRVVMFNDSSSSASELNIRLESGNPYGL